MVVPLVSGLTRLLICSLALLVVCSCRLSYLILSYVVLCRLMSSYLGLSRLISTYLASQFPGESGGAMRTLLWAAFGLPTPPPGQRPGPGYEAGQGQRRGRELQQWQSDRARQLSELAQQQAAVSRLCLLHGAAPVIFDALHSVSEYMNQ